MSSGTDHTAGQRHHGVVGIEPESVGVWQQTADVNVAAHLASAGFDWLALDAQHGAIDRAALLPLGRALSDRASNFVVRVPDVQPSWIGAALDAGAAGVVVPTVDSIADAETVVRATYYPPQGQRSWGAFGALWGTPMPAAPAANQQVQCAVMIETAAALADVDAIAAVEGVGALFIGPYDLSLAVGTSLDALLTDGSPDAPIPTIVRAAQRHGRVVAAFAGDPARVPAFRALGVHALAVITDLGLLDRASAEVIAGSRRNTP